MISNFGIYLFIYSQLFQILVHVLYSTDFVFWEIVLKPQIIIHDM